MSRRGPNLDTLVAKHGGYHKIPASAWETFDREVKAWQLERRDLYSSQTEDDDDER